MMITNLEGASAFAVVESPKHGAHIDGKVRRYLRSLLAAFLLALVRVLRQLYDNRSDT